jgi:hypothetical protein
MNENQNNNKLEWNKVSALYTSFINNRNNKEIQSQFFNTAIKYVIKNPDCIICQRSEFCTELMFCFSCPPTEILLKFIKAIESQLRKCANCIDKYHEVLIPQFYKISLPLYGKSGLDKFVNDMLEWDAKRISSHLEFLYEQLLNSTGDIVLWKKIRAQTSYPFYEIFKFPKVLKSWDVDSNFIKLLQYLLEKETKFTLFNNVFPSILFFTLHHTDFIRLWAIKSFSNNNNEVFPSFQADKLKPYFEEIVLYLEEKLPSDLYQPLENGKLNKYYHFTGDIDIFLHGICYIISVIHSDILVILSGVSIQIFKLMTSLFGHWKSLDVILFINTMETFFKSLTFNIWDTKITNYNEVVSIFKIILNNETYKKILSSPEIFNSLQNKRSYFNWIYYFSESAECVYALVSVELWKYTIKQSNEWCKEAQDCFKQFVYETIQYLKKVEVVDILLQYCLKEMKEVDHQSKLLEIAKRIIEEDTKSIQDNHEKMCIYDQMKTNDKNDNDNDNNNDNNNDNDNDNDNDNNFTNLINLDDTNEEIKKIKIKSVHLLTWRYLCSFDIIKSNNELFETLMKSFEKLSFIFSDRHNHDQYVDNLVFIRRYIFNLFKEFSEQTINTLKNYFSNEEKIAVLVHYIFSCDDALNQITTKVLDKIMIKNIDDDILDPLILVFSEYSDMCIKLFIEKLNQFNVLSKDKDIFCMLHFSNSIGAIIKKLIPNIRKITKVFEIKNSLEAAIFNFLYQIINRCRQWAKVKPNEGLLITQVLHNTLDIVSDIVKSIKNLDADCEFFNFKNDLVFFISPLSKQLIYENGRIYFDKIFNLIINIINFIEPPNKLDEKYINILKKLYESDTLLSVHKEKLLEILQQLGGIEGIKNKEQQNITNAITTTTTIANSTTTNGFNITSSMLSPKQMTTPLPNGMYNVYIPYQQQYFNQNQINFLNNNSLNLLQNNNLSFKKNTVFTVNDLNNIKNNL